MDSYCSVIDCPYFIIIKCTENSATPHAWMCECGSRITGIQCPCHNSNSFRKSQDIRNFACLKIVVSISSYPYHCAICVKCILQCWQNSSNKVKHRSHCALLGSVMSSCDMILLFSIRFLHCIMLYKNLEILKDIYCQCKTLLVCNFQFLLSFTFLHSAIQRYLYNDGLIGTHVAIVLQVTWKLEIIKKSNYADIGRVAALFQLWHSQYHQHRKGT